MKYFRRKTQHFRQNFLYGFLAVGLFLAFPALTSAAPGDLDMTFGNGGIVITGNSFNPALNVAKGMAIQPDGKIVVVGEGSLGTFNWDFGVVRYNTNGTLDTSFGGSGIVVIQLTVNYDGAEAVAIQPDGKIVVVGSHYNCFCIDSSFAVLRFNPNGTLDTSFNGTGRIITSVNSSRDYAHSVAIQADGKIVVAGSSGANDDFALVRYNPNGSLDTTFNATGKVITPVGGGAGSVVIQSDGKIIAAGNSGNFTLVRYNPNGSLDSTFNGTGIVTTSVGDSNSGASSVAIQTDGKIVAVGSGNNGSNTNFAVVRYNPNGSLDTSFGSIGKILIPIGNSDSAAYSIAIQSDGKVVAVGYSGNGNTGSDFAVARLNPNGSLDTTFGGTGKIITPIVNQDFISFATAVAIQADGKIVVAGCTDSGFFDFCDFAVVRYQGGSNANIRTRFDFDGDGKADQTVFRPSDHVWYLLRSGSGFTAAQFGVSTDKITPADFDGDGKTDIAVFRDGIWYWLNSSNNSFNAFQFGQAGDIPVSADYTGDGRAEMAVYRAGIWYTWNLANSQFNTVQFGISTDKPVPADFDADGKTDFAVYRDGVWYMLGSTVGFSVVQFGIASDKPTVGDFDGDSKADQAVYRSGVWYVLGSTQGFYAVQFGIASDIPTAADYDGDGKTDIAVYRDGIWYMLRSQQGFGAVQFGVANDKPIPAAYVP
jgi:uncharacterized delta-60 repeat protein